MKAYHAKLQIGTVTKTRWFWTYKAAMNWLMTEIGKEEGIVQSLSATRKTLPTWIVPEGPRVD